MSLSCRAWRKRWMSRKAWKADTMYRCLDCTEVDGGDLENTAGSSSRPGEKMAAYDTKQLPKQSKPKALLVPNYNNNAPHPLLLFSEKLHEPPLLLVIPDLHFLTPTHISATPPQTQHIPVVIGVNLPSPPTSPSPPRPYSPFPHRP